MMGLQYDRTIRDHHAQRPILETRRPDAADRLADACTRVLMGAFGLIVIAGLVVSTHELARFITWLMQLFT